MNTIYDPRAIRVSIEKGFGALNLTLLFYSTDIHGNATHIAKPLEMRPIEDTDRGSIYMAAPPGIQIGRDVAQEFMDALWRVGVRPAEAAGSTGQLAATEAHLKDMRGLVRKFLDVPL